MRTGPDGPDHLLRLGGGKNELEVLRRLLDHLQQGVEARRGDHVGLVDDVDLVAAGGGPEEGLLPQVTGVVHTTVRGGVDLDDVDRPRSVARQVLAGLACAAGLGSGTLLTVQAPRQDPRAGGLATASGPAEQVRVIDPVVPQGLHQGDSDMLLPDDLGERLGAVAAVQRKGRHVYEVIRAHRQRRPADGPADRPGTQSAPTHPPEPTYPCCLPALGELGEIAPREGLGPTLADESPGFDPSPLRIPTGSPPGSPADDHVREHPSTSCIVCRGGFA